MDYEKKYKEAQKWIESIYSELSHEQQMEAEAFFPELKESEDERTRKEILNVFKQLYEDTTICGRNYDYTKWIAWLEKQGEKKSIDYNEELKKCRENPLYFFDKYVKIEERKPALSKGDEKIRKTLIDYFKTYKKQEECGIKTFFGIPTDNILAWLEKQGNHKPIDKIQLGKKYKCIASPRYSTFRRGNIYKPVDNFLCNLMNLCYECFEPIEDSEQKPADKVEPKFKIKYAGREYNVLEIKENMGITWYGIEDEPNHIDYVKANSCEIISGYAIKENGSPYPTKPVVFSEKKPKRMISAEAKEALYDKPTWSEEDENKIDTIISVYHPSPNIVDWLKSIKDKYTWKPSEEQLEALLNILPSGNQQLFSLYNDLKKLK